MEELRNAPDIVLQKDKKPKNKKMIFLVIFAVIVIAICVTLTVISSNMGSGKSAQKQTKSPYDTMAEYISSPDNQIGLTELDEIFIASQEVNFPFYSILDDEGRNRFAELVDSYQIACDTLCSLEIDDNHDKSNILKQIQGEMKNRLVIYKNTKRNIELLYESIYNSDETAIKDVKQDSKLSPIYEAITSMQDPNGAGLENSTDTSNEQEQIAYLEWYNSNDLGSQIIASSSSYNAELFKERTVYNLIDEFKSDIKVQDEEEKDK